MEATQNTIVKFMQQQDTHFVIPVYQRPYTWHREQCRQILADIRTVAENETLGSHFLGSIVYLRTNITSTPHVLTVIDGQQRLTSLMLLCLALYNRAREAGNMRFAEEFQEKFLINKYLENEEKIKLRSVAGDDAAFRYLLEGNNHQAYPIQTSHIIQNYGYFYDHIPLSDIESIRAGLQKLVFVEIALESNKDDAQRIFQSLNSTGLDLSAADLIRNYVLMDRPPKLQEQLYAKYWAVIEQNTREAEKGESKLSEFVRDYLTMHTRTIPTKDRVFETFKQHYTFENETILRERLEDMKAFSGYYHSFLMPESETDAAIAEHLHGIHSMQITVAYPFLLEVMHDYAQRRISKDILLRVLETVESYVWRRFICDLPTNALNKVFSTLYKDISADDVSDYAPSLERALVRRKGKHRFPTDVEVAHELETKDMYKIKPGNRLYFLERLENAGERVKTQVVGNEHISVEHVFPQKPTREWERSLGAELDEMKSRANTAANLTLSAFNPSLSNRLFLEKRDLKPGGYADSNLRIDKFLATVDAWNCDALRRRHMWIVERFTTIWQYPHKAAETVQITQQQAQLEMSVDIRDIMPNEATNKDILRFEFMNTVLERCSWRDVLKAVASAIIERDPQPLLELDAENKLVVKTIDKGFTKSIAIGGYFIESSLSAQAITQRVQVMLERSGLEEECLITLQERGMTP
ncbi:MAG: DUF262 domain-containing protein [Candidatus Kapaibacterium sp.]|nr:MAG: DUF262 domain-containing protein [Candidatus Kapabacteria bacterium]